jgi:hypothetical protein
MLRLSNELASKIRSIQSSRLTNKQALINSLITLYNTNVANIKRKFNEEIAKTRAFVPKMGIERINKKKALLIGCNYLNTRYALSGCIDDAARMKEILSQRGFTDFTILTDTSNIKPTKDNILNQIRQLISSSTPGDVLFFYFSGHGSSTYDRNGDETDGNDEMIISTDLKGVLDDEIAAILSSSMKDGVLLIALFDSCHSGTMLDLKYNYLDSNNYDKYTENNNVNELKGDIIMISGCMDSQTSTEAFINNKFQGALTWSLIDTLQKNPKCTWRELVKTMRNLLKNSGYTQIPQISSGAFENIDAQIII